MLSKAVPDVSARRPDRRGARRAAVLGLAVATLTAACSGSDEAAPEVTIAATPSTLDASAPTADGVLKLGVLVPETGSQANLGPALRSAARLAVDDVNAAGGVLGKPVEVIFADAGDATTDTAGASVDAFAAAKVDVIVGPPSSGVTSLVLDKVKRSTAALIAPGNALADAPTDVPYVQLSPDLGLLGHAVGQRLAEAGNARTALIVGRDDPFGQRVSDAAAAVLDDAGITATVQRYNPESDVYRADVAAAVAAAPAQVVFVGYAEVAEFLSGFIAAGITPATTPTYVVSDRVDNVLFRRFSEPGALSGAELIGQGSDVAANRDGFVQRLQADAGQLDTTTFSAETYDAVVTVALAATRAGSDAPGKLRDAASAVTGGGPGGGEGCDEVPRCLSAAQAGELSYTGVAGPYRLDGSGKPTEALFAAYPLGADNKLDMANAVTFRVVN